jgi:nitroreductase
MTTTDTPLEKPADTSVALHPMIARRWSPRAFDADGEVSDAQLRALLEAARWAPSYGNTQPARYLVGRRGDPTHKRIFDALNEGNQKWARRASVLMVALMKTRNEKGAVPLAEYGAGLATENLVLQAVAEGLAAHQMAGFDAEQVCHAFELPSDVVPLAAIAIGPQADPTVLDDERAIARERAERRRIPLADLALSEWAAPLRLT